MKKAARIVLLVLIAVIAINFVPSNVHVKFSNAAVQYYCQQIALCLFPVMIAAFFLLAEKRWLKIVGGVLAGIVAVFCLLFFALTRTVRHSFELLQELSSKPYVYRLYRTNVGATTAFGLVVQKENEIGVGLKTVQHVYSRYKASRGSMELQEGNSLKLSIQPDDKKSPPEVVVVPIP